jgi:hypothetical protein
MTLVEHRGSAGNGADELKQRRQVVGASVLRLAQLKPLDASAGVCFGLSQRALLMNYLWHVYKQ